MLKVVCFKWNHNGGYKLPSISVIGGYSAKHVNILYKAISHYLTIPHEFICITDDPTGIECKTIPLWNKCRELGGCYNRLYVFSKDMKELIGDRFVCIDLDVAITGNLDTLFSRKEPLIINKFYGGNSLQFYNGALFMMDAGAADHVWSDFERDIPGSIRKLNELVLGKKLLGTDQAWISYKLGRGVPMFLDTEGVLAYRRLEKNGTGRKLPKNGKMVFFAGTNDPSICLENNLWVQGYWYGDYTNYDTISIKGLEANLEAIKQESLKSVNRLGYLPNILYPKTLTEKIKWRKLFCRNPLMGEVVDKVEVYNYVNRTLVNGDASEILIPLIGVYDRGGDIDFHNLPDLCVIKPNHLSGKLLFYKKGKYSKDQIVKQCDLWLNSKYDLTKNEWPYSTIKPRILIQEFIGLDVSKPPKDFKFHMFNGKCELIQVFTDRFTPGFSRPGLAFYTADWERIDMNSKGYPDGPDCKKPETLQKMLDISVKLSQPFDYVRIDLYEIGSHIYFGELTFSPHSGNFAFNKVSFDYEMGRKLNLSLNG